MNNTQENDKGEQKRISSSNSLDELLISKSPNSPITNKKKILRKIIDDCRRKVKLHKKKFKKLKKTDDVLDGMNAFLTGSSISCTVIGMQLPPLLIVSASLSGTAFIISRVQDKYNLKRRYEQHKITIQQYQGLVREILSVMTKNNLSREEYENYVEEIYDKISLIEDTSIIV